MQKHSTFALVIASQLFVVLSQNQKFAGSISVQVYVGGNWLLFLSLPSSLSESGGKLSFGEDERKERREGGKEGEREGGKKRKEKKKNVPS